MKISFSEKGWEDFSYWLQEDKKTLKKIQKLLDDISRNGNVGMGHPEPLKGSLTGYWSREIDKKNRLIYLIDGDVVLVTQCKDHYSDR